MAVAVMLAALAASASAATEDPAAAAQPASTPDAGAAQALPTVQTRVQRGDFMPYKQLNEILTKLRVEGEGVFVGRFKLQNVDKSQPLPANAKLALMDDDRTIDIPIAADGRFDLPTFPEAEAKAMELGTNLSRNTTSISLRIDLSTPPDQLDMAGVRRAVRIGQHLRGELLPWYVRWMFPQIDGVMVCSDQPSWSLEWPENGQTMALPLPADTTAREPETAKDKPSRPCTTLTGQEPWPDNARLQSDAAIKTKLYVKLRQGRAS